MREERAMNEHPHETIVVGVDASSASAAAVRWAAAEADRRGARLHAVHVVEPARRSRPDQDLRLQLDIARQTVPGRVGDWVFRSGVAVDIAVSVVTGDIAAQLAREAGDAALMVIGAPESLHHSDLPDDLVRACVCPVVMVGSFGDVTSLPAPPPAAPSAAPSAAGRGDPDARHTDAPSRA
jgi:nucleotide-binding universal stress UspA family protein